MEEKPVCRIEDGFVKQALLMAGISEGKSRFIIADKSSDKGDGMDTVVIPLYAAGDYIKKRIPEYGREKYEE